MESKRYDNVENLSENEISAILAYSFSFIGPNRLKRKRTLESYSTEEISKEDWVKKYIK